MDEIDRTDPVFAVALHRRDVSGGDRRRRRGDRWYCLSGKAYFGLGGLVTGRSD